MRKTLIIEDNYMLADMVEDTLIANGYEVCGLAGTVAEGVELYLEHKPDLLIIDLRLENGELGTEMAARIAPFDKVGILYVTGSNCEFQLSRADGHACLSKPYRASELLQSLEIVTELASTGNATPPLPAGLHVLKLVMPGKLVQA